MATLLSIEYPLPLADGPVALARTGAPVDPWGWRGALDAAPLALLNTALRTDAVELRDGLALRATNGRKGPAEYAAQVDGSTTHAGVLEGVVSAPALAELGAYWCGRAADEESTARGLKVLEALLEVHGPESIPVKLRTIPLQQALLSGRPEVAARWIDDLPGARQQVVHGVRVDLARPENVERVRRAAGDPTPVDSRQSARWLRAFNKPFAWGGLTPVTLTAPGQVPFDRMEAAPPHQVEDGPLVTVLMPCWRPDEGLITSVRSIVDQTWRPLEIIVLDDASGPEFAELFARVAQMDPRIRVESMPRNGGSYIARNHGIAISSGEFVTVQDADDWSHPERIERHVRHLQDHPEVAANRSRAIRVKDDLTHQWLGYPPFRQNASSLMVRRSVLQECGLFQAVRKGADSEYHFRLEALGFEVIDLSAVLAVIRLSMGSLSRGDFQWNRNSPDRLAYRGVYAAWHRQLAGHAQEQDRDPRALAAASGISDPRTLPFWVPRAWNRNLPSGARQTHPGGDDEVVHEWVLRGDFSQRRRARQVREFLAEGLRPVLWHQERPLPVSEARPELSDEVADLIVSGGLAYISAQERVRARNLVVLDRGLASRDAGLVRADQVWIDADRLLDGSDLAFLGDLTAAPRDLRRSFGTEPRWVTRGAVSRSPVQGTRRAPWLD